MIAVSWSVQRADHGEQPYWMAIALAAMLGQIGLPGGGFGFGYGATGGIGSPQPRLPLPQLPTGVNPVQAYIPVARFNDMLLNPGASFEFNGHRLTYPDIRLVYWCGGNPFHKIQDSTVSCAPGRGLKPSLFTSPGGRQRRGGPISCCPVPRRWNAMISAGHRAIASTSSCKKPSNL